MPQRNKKLLLDPAAIATPLVILAVDLYGTEALSWEPEVLGDELEEYAGAPIPQTNKDAIQAIIMLLESDRFFADPRIFNYICNALSEEGEVLFTVFDPATPEELGWGVSEALLHKPLATDETTKKRFQRDVQIFITEVLLDYGFLIAPPPLDFIELEVPEERLSSIRDDPLMFEAAWKVQNANGARLGRGIKERLRLMLQQLSQLRLTNGSLEKVQSRLSTILS